LAGRGPRLGRCLLGCDVSSVVLREPDGILAPLHSIFAPLKTTLPIAPFPASSWHYSSPPFPCHSPPLFINPPSPPLTTYAPSPSMQLLPLRPHSALVRVCSPPSYRSRPLLHPSERRYHYFSTPMSSAFRPSFLLSSFLLSVANRRRDCRAGLLPSRPRNSLLTIP